MIDSGPVLLDLEGGVARVRLNRPEASNGLDVPLLQALYDALMQCHGDPRVRAVLLSGEGPHFCAGGDVKTFASKGEALPDYLREATSWLQISASALMRLNAPVVTIVHGFAAGGGGFGLVCASDIVIAAESARFLLGATRVGMAPDAGSSVTLQRIVGHRRAMEIALTNPPLTATQADGRVDVGVRPEDVLVGEACLRVPVEHRFEAVVNVVEPMGSESLLTVGTNGVDLRIRLDGRRYPEIGMRMCFAIDPAELHLFDAVTGVALRRRGE